MKTELFEDKVIISEYDSFDIEETLECGQCFRFYKLGDKHYKIVAYSRELFILQQDGVTEFYPTNLEDFNSIWLKYFDLERDYDEIKQQLAKNDPILSTAIEFAGGIRILNQQPFETIISFIVSQNNRIPMIKKVINNISNRFGDKINEEYAFPTLEQFICRSVDEINECKTGFRGKYIHDAINKISEGLIKLESFHEKTTVDLKNELMSIHGIGTKVADCILLFSCGRHEVFPTDVWVKRIMSELYLKNSASLAQISKAATELFGSNAGFAQQYLFHYARIHNIGKK